MQPNIRRVDEFGTQAPAVPGSRARASEFIAGVYRWMAIGLLITAGVAWFVVSTPALMNAIVSNQLLLFGLPMAELALVFWLSARINKLSVNAATIMFLTFSALNGATISLYLMIYTASSVASTFVITAGMFGTAAVWGATTKRDLSGMGSFLFMGLIGIIIASVVNMFMGSSRMDWIISVAGVGIFAGLAAYDNQRLRRMADQVGSGESLAKATIMGALALYLDFINLFIMLLRLLGDRRD